MHSGCQSVEHFEVLGINNLDKIKEREMSRNGKLSEGVVTD